MISPRRWAARAPAEVEAGGLLAAGVLAAHPVDLLQKRVDVAAAFLRRVELLAVGAEGAQLPAEGNMDIEAQPPAFREGQDLIVFVLKDKGPGGAGQPHTSQFRNHMYLKYVRSISAIIRRFPRNSRVYSATKK